MWYGVCINCGVVFFLILGKVLGHNKGTSQPKDQNDDDCLSLDAKVKCWFYNTCEAGLPPIITQTCT